MKVRMKTHQVGPEVNRPFGAVVDLDDDEAKRLVDADLADEVKEDKPKGRKAAKPADVEKATEADADVESR